VRPLLLAVALLASGCASLPRATQGGKLLDVWSKISDKSYIRTRGVGAVPAGAIGQTARRGVSRNAALLAARYELLSVIKGVKLSGGITVAQLAEKDSLIRELANDLVMGGEEVQSEWLSDDGCVITLELRRATVERLIQEKSDRERGLEKRIAKDIREIEKLNRLLATAVHSEILDMDPDLVEAVHDKAVMVQVTQTHVDALQKKMDAGYQPTMPELIENLNQVAAVQAIDPKERAKNSKRHAQEVREDESSEMDEVARMSKTLTAGEMYERYGVVYQYNGETGRYVKAGK
jgi:hypothetical protein